MSIQDLLQEADKNYNPEICLLGGEFNGPGYHTRIPNGTWAHSTKASIHYAVQLLNAGDKELVSRALDIVRKIVSLQETNPYNPNYGLWSWLYEEPLDQMSPPDFNWADFIGAALSHVVIEHGDKLPKDLYEATAASIGHAAWSIFRRNMQPHYTNIAIMGVVVTAVAGELLDEDRLLDYARIRLQAFIDYTIEQGGLNEYNSPTYTFVALHEVERIIQLVQDSEIFTDAERLRSMIWKALSDYFHPATGQLAGPHSRAYADTLAKSTINFINWAVDDYKTREFEAETIGQIGRGMPCPAEYTGRFKALPAPELERHDRFIKRENPDKSFTGAVWMNQDAALGSINYECFWTQRRPLLGYWLDGSGEVAVLKLRMLKNGKDFAAGGLHNAQSANKVLTGIKMFTDRGDYHIHLDRPEESCYTLNSLVLRYELTATDAEVVDKGSGLYELSAGDWKAAITALPGVFNGNPVAWRTGKSGNIAYVEAVLYEGAVTQLTVDESVYVNLVQGTELLKVNSIAGNDAPVVLEKDALLHVAWKGLHLKYDPCAGEYDSK